MAITTDCPTWQAIGLSPTERKNMSAVSMVNEKTHRVVGKRWTPTHLRLLKSAANYPEVGRILINPGTKKKLCETAIEDRSWLDKV